MVFYSFMHEIIWNLVPSLYTIYIVFILSQVDLHSSKIQLFIQDNHYLIDKAVYSQLSRKCINISTCIGGSHRGQLKSIEILFLRSFWRRRLDVEKSNFVYLFYKYFIYLNNFQNRIFAI